MNGRHVHAHACAHRHTTYIKTGKIQELQNASGSMNLFHYFKTRGLSIMQPLSPRAGCVTALNLKPEALLAFKNGPAFTLKSDKVIWIRENQCTAETPPPPPTIGTFSPGCLGLMEVRGQSMKTEFPSLLRGMNLPYRQHLAIRRVRVFFPGWRNSFSSHLPELLLHSLSFW